MNFTVITVPKNTFIAELAHSALTSQKCAMQFWIVIMEQMREDVVREGLKKIKQISDIHFWL